MFEVNDKVFKICFVLVLIFIMQFAKGEDYVLASSNTSGTLAVYENIGVGIYPKRIISFPGIIMAKIDPITGNVYTITKDSGIYPNFRFEAYDKSLLSGTSRASSFITSIDLGVDSVINLETANGALYIIGTHYIRDVKLTDKTMYSKIVFSLSLQSSIISARISNDEAFILENSNQTGGMVKVALDVYRITPEGFIVNGRVKTFYNSEKEIAFIKLSVSQPTPDFLYIILPYTLSIFHHDSNSPGGYYEAVADISISFDKQLERLLEFSSFTNLVSLIKNDKAYVYIMAANISDGIIAAYVLNPEHGYSPQSLNSYSHLEYYNGMDFVLSVYRNSLFTVDSFKNKLIHFKIDPNGKTVSSFVSDDGIVGYMPVRIGAPD